MIEEACVDAYGEDEQLTGLFAMLEEHLMLPFQTEVFGAAVIVAAVEMTDRGRIVAVCQRGDRRQRIALEDLPLPSPSPAGAAWILAYRQWLCG
jgi:hypothetical protein